MEQIYIMYKKIDSQKVKKTEVGLVFTRIGYGEEIYYFGGDDHILKSKWCSMLMTLLSHDIGKASLLEIDPLEFCSENNS